MKKWRNQGGALCWGEEYKTSKQVQKLTDEQIKDIVCTVVTDLAGYVCVPASMVASTIWTGTGYVHDPDR